MNESLSPSQPLVILSDGTSIDLSLIHSSPGAGQVGLFTEFLQLSVVPGKSVTTSVVIFNQGVAAERVSLVVEGVPTDWLEALPHVCHLAPGSHEKVVLVIKPPHWPQSKAGRHALTLQAISESDKTQVAEVKVILTVAAYSEFISALTPQTVEAGGVIQVNVHNQGNTPETFTVTCQGVKDDLTFTPAQAHLPIPEGGAGIAEFRVGLRQPHWVGNLQSHRFSVQVSAPEGEPQTHSGEVFSTALIPVWALLMFFVLCLGCTSMVALYTTVSDSQAAGATQTALAQFTGVVVAIKTADAQQTANVFASQTAVINQTAAGWATQTAIALQTEAAQATLTADTDNDGLTDQEEIRSGTSPTDPDSDDDDLSDGEEKAWGTNPHVIDSDSDTLLDGAEVHVLKTSPVNRDTDGDGLNDNVDPDPAHVPTNTAAPTLTAEPTFTPSPPPPTSPPTTTPSPSPPTPGPGVILFQSNRDGNAQIYVMASDGAAQTRLTNTAANDTVPAWSADGARIVFVSERDGNPEIYVMNSDGSAQTRLTNNATGDTAPAWAPDGTHIVFVSTRDGNPEIYVMNSDGTAQTRLTNNSANEGEPAWSPDGTRIAFTSTRDNNVEIYVMNADGSAPIRLTEDVPLLGPTDQSPAWSPDGARLVFASTREGNLEIYVMNADGTAQTRLTNNNHDDSQPAWSPDGTQLVFASEADGDAEIYMMNADGSGSTQLTNNTVEDVKPVWRR